MGKPTAWIYELIITPIVVIPIMWLDVMWDLVRLIFKIESRYHSPLLNRWLNYECKKTHNF